MYQSLMNSLCAKRLRFAVVSLLAAFAMMSAEAIWAQATMQIINNFKTSTPNAANYFSNNYPDDQVWLYFLNTSGTVTYTDSNGAQQTVQNAQSIQLSTVKDGNFTLATGANSTKVFAGLGSSNPFSGINGPGIFDQNLPYALAEWTINGNAFDNIDLSYQDSFSFPTRLTVKNASGAQTDQCSFTAGTQAANVISALKAAMPNQPTGPAGDNYPAPGAAGWGPLVPTVSGSESANRWIGSSKTWTSAPDSGNLRGIYIYAPSLNAYLKYLKENETSQFKNGIQGWFIDYSGNNGYSGYLSVTGTDHNYGLNIHNIRVNTSPSAANHWKADPKAGTITNGQITVLADNATIPFASGTPDTSNVTGLWTDAVIYSGAALIGDLGGGPVVTGTGDFADAGQYNSIVATMMASISASMATGLMGSTMYTTKISDSSSPGATMYWFNTMTRAESTQKLFDKAWTQGQEFYDPFWKTLADLTNMQGYLSPFNDRWANFSPDFILAPSYTITWELGITAAAPGTYSISGAVSGAVQAGVIVTLSGTSTGTATTGDNGTYSFNNLSNGNYVITPSLSGYTFNPSSSSVTIAGASQSGKNFVSSAVIPGTHSISGTISGDVQEGVTVTLSGASSSTTTTSHAGTYSFANLADGVYSVMPQLTGFFFEPESRPVTLSGADQTGQDFISNGGQTAYGTVFTIEASEIQGLPTPDKFMVKPKVYVEYDIWGKDGLKSNITVMTKVDKNTGASSVECLWAKKIKLYDTKAFKDAQKQGTSASLWLAVPENQKNLHMDLRLASKEVQDQSVRPIALAVPLINGISSGGKDAKGNDTLIISGQWFGTKTLKVWREYTAEGGNAIKQQTMKVIKPTEADAAAGYRDNKGKPAFMNYETGASKVTVIIPAKLPKGALNGIIVLDNNIGMAAGNDPSN